MVERMMTGPAKPDYIKIMRFIVAIRMVRFDRVCSLALGTICRLCQLSSFQCVKNGIAGARKHPRMFFMFLTPPIIHKHFAFSDLFKIGEFVFGG